MIHLPPSAEVPPVCSARPGQQCVQGVLCSAVGSLPAGSRGCECQQCALRSDAAVRGPLPVRGPPSPSPLAPGVSGPCCWRSFGLCTPLPETPGPLWRTSLAPPVHGRPPRRGHKHLSSPPGHVHPCLPLFQLLPSQQGLAPVPDSRAAPEPLPAAAVFMPLVDLPFCAWRCWGAHVASWGEDPELWGKKAQLHMATWVWPCTHLVSQLHCVFRTL